jgi:hypothetical protein
MPRSVLERVPKARVAPLQDVPELPSAVVPQPAPVGSRRPRKPPIGARKVGIQSCEDGEGNRRSICSAPSPDRRIAGKQWWTCGAFPRLTGEIVDQRALA